MSSDNNTPSFKQATTSDMGNILSETPKKSSNAAIVADANQSAIDIDSSENEDEHLMANDNTEIDKPVEMEPKEVAKENDNPTERACSDGNLSSFCF